MGIYDRDYYSDRGRGRSGFGQTRPGGVRKWSVNTWIIVVNIAVFVIQGFLRDTYVIIPNPNPRLSLNMDILGAAGHFSTTEGFGHLEVWRLVTFQFLHAGPMHVLMNMFGLFVFGGLVEQHLGRKKYLAFYLVCGIAGGMMYLILNLMGLWNVPMIGSLVHRPDTPLIGASAGVFGVIVACARIAPDMAIRFFLIPIDLKMKWVAYGYVAISIFNLLTSGHNAGGDAAHIGGAAAGYFFIRNSHYLRGFFDVFQNSNRPDSKRGKAGSGKQQGGGRKGPNKAGKPSENEVDKVLRKVSSSGLHSLSEKEKKILRKASQD